MLTCESGFCLAVLVLVAIDAQCQDPVIHWELENGTNSTSLSFHFYVLVGIL